MDGLTHLDPAVGAQPSPAFIGFFAALANLRATGEARLAEAEITLAEGEAAINRGIEAIARMVANDRAAAEGGGRLDWDYRIERLEFYEAEAARDVSRMRRLVDRILAGARDADPAIGRRARALARRQEDAVLRFVEALRDARWQMMALRANFEADSRDGRTFDNPAEMRHYLAAS
jgi:hypothetical protein